MIRYDTDQTPQKWTRKELMSVAGAAVLLLCIWALISWRNYAGDETQRLLDRTRTQLAAAKEKIASLDSRLAETEKQLADANSKVLALTSVAHLAPQLPVYVKQWKNGPTTFAVALENQGEVGISVHLTLSNPDQSRPREQECRRVGRQSGQVEGEAEVQCRRVHSRGVSSCRAGKSRSGRL